MSLNIHEIFSEINKQKYIQVQFKLSTLTTTTTTMTMTTNSLRVNDHYVGLESANGHKMAHHQTDNKLKLLK